MPAAKSEKVKPSDGSVTIRFKPEAYEELALRAGAASTTVGPYVRQLIVDYLAGTGELQEKPTAAVLPSPIAPAAPSASALPRELGYLKGSVEIAASNALQCLKEGRDHAAAFTTYAKAAAATDGRVRQLRDDVATAIHLILKFIQKSPDWLRKLSDEDIDKLLSDAFPREGS